MWVGGSRIPPKQFDHCFEIIIFFSIFTMFRISPISNSFLLSKILYFFGLILLSSLCWGQNEEAIQADRPDQSDGIHILNPGSFQLETGFIFEHTDKKLYDIIQSTLLRYGVGPNWEFRILINEGFTSDDAFKTPSFGLDPISISAKVALLSQQQIIPAITLVTYLQLPFAASKKNKVDYYAPTVLLAFENEVNSRFVLGYNIGISWDGIEKNRNIWPPFLWGMDCLTGGLFLANIFQVLDRSS